jgi:hypothetical protein
MRIRLLKPIGASALTAAVPVIANRAPHPATKNTATDFAGGG